MSAKNPTEQYAKGAHVMKFNEALTAGLLVRFIKEEIHKVDHYNRLNRLKYKKRRKVKQ